MMSSQRSTPVPRDIDWPALRARLREAMESTSELLDASSPYGQQILAERARRLAEETLSQDTTAQWASVLTFVLQGEQYAIETRFVWAAAPVPPIARVPAAPPYFEGLVAWRGHVLAAVQLDRLFGMSSSAANAPRYLLVLGDEQPQLALVLAPPFEVRRCNAVLNTAPIAWAESPLGEHLRGVTDEHWLWLDGGSLLQDQRFIFS